MFIQTEATANPAVVKFLPGRTVVQSGVIDFADAEAAGRSPLARRLFEIGPVAGVFLGPDFITVTRRDDADWQQLRPAVLGAIMEHFVAGEPVLDESDAAEEIEIGFDPAAEQLVSEIEEVIEARVRPAVERSGGDVSLRGFRDGIAYLELQGAAAGLRDGIGNMLRHYVPEVVAVRDYQDAIAKPGLATPEGAAVQQLLDERINPAVASHGGYIALVDVKDSVVYIRLEGGCQGCGMADVTLKQGVEVEIKQTVPSITAVLDVTDHAGGGNPYYQPGKGGASPY